MSSTSGTRAGRIETVQILRAVAVFAVVVSHAMHELVQLLRGAPLVINEKLFPGDFGVDLFFVISGFIMVYVSRNSFARAGASLDYVKRRLIRIVPLYWIMTSLMILVVILLPHSVDTATNDRVQWLSSYLFFPYARSSDGMVRPVLGLGWSLEYEMFFYLLFAIGLMMRRTAAILFVSAMIGLTWALGRGPLSHVTAVNFLGMPIIFEFVVGMVIGWLFVSGRRMPRMIALMLIVAGVGILAFAPSFNEALERSRYLYYGIPAALIVMGSTLFRNSESFVVSPVGLELGENSYATYLAHPFWLGALSLVCARAGLSTSMSSEGFIVWYLVLAILGSFACGFLLDRIVDKPLTRWLSARIVPRKVPA
ncbi:MAG: acyltransferase [Rhizobiaceae bacterium]